MPLTPIDGGAFGEPLGACLLHYIPQQRVIDGLSGEGGCDKWMDALIAPQ